MVVMQAATAGLGFLRLISAVGGLLITVGLFYLLLKIAGLVDALKDSVKEKKT